MKSQICHLQSRSGQALAKAVSDKQWVVRAAAIEALAKRGDPARLPDIEPALLDRKDVVRFSAAAAVLHLDHLARGTATSGGGQRLDTGAVAER